MNIRQTVTTTMNLYNLYMYKALNGFLHVQGYVLCILCYTANTMATLSGINSKEKGNSIIYNKNK